MTIEIEKLIRADCNPLHRRAHLRVDKPWTSDLKMCTSSLLVCHAWYTGRNFGEVTTVQVRAGESDSRLHGSSLVPALRSENSDLGVANGMNSARGESDRPL